MSEPKFLDQSGVVDLVAQMGPFHLVPVVGNLGDALIRFATHQGLSERGLAPQVQSHGLATVFPGGASLVPVWDSRRVVDCMEPHECGLILPHTLRGIAHLLRERPGIQVIARDLRTWQYLIDGGVDADRLFVADDAAFWLQSWVHSQSWESPNGTLIAFRGDIESAGTIAVDPGTSFDISQAWTSTWTEQDQLERAASAFLAFLAKFEAVVTDRLHVAIGAALLGRTCYLFDNSYGKNRSIYEFSLRGKFDCVTWCESINDVPATVLRSAASRTEVQMAWSHLVTGIPRPSSRPVRFQDRVISKLGLRSLERIRHELSEIQGMGIQLTPTEMSRYARVRLGRDWRSSATVKVSTAFEILKAEMPEDVTTVVSEWVKRASPGAALGITRYWSDLDVRARVDNFVESHPQIDVRRVGATLVLVTPL